ncbi:UbiE/COQ5 methyltransferase [Pavlovales sp. CCMP2436]|nr:UbiE/COQ5 methyltransferase [Pavlovales sp. CCMP2436]
MVALALRARRLRAPLARCLHTGVPARASMGGNNAESSTHFGFSEVPTGEKAKKVREVFSRVADSYDVMNDVMSAGVHRVWKDHFVHGMGLPATQASSPGGVRVLDVAGGTGDIAFRIADALAGSAPVHLQQQGGSSAESGVGARSEVTVYDINTDMLRVGEQRAIKRPSLQRAGAPLLRWVEGDAEKLPFEDNSFDLYSIAFGIRNVTNVPNALKEARRVLRPGGRFVCLEFSQVENPLLRKFYDEYSFHVIPAMGAAVANDRASYQYLVESIRKFPTQPEFAKWISEAGFEAVSYSNLTFGAVAVHTGFKL